MKFLLCIDGDVSRGEDSQAPRSKPREREKVKPRAVYFEMKQESLQSAGTPTYLKVRSHAVVIAGLGC